MCVFYPCILSHTFKVRICFNIIVFLEVSKSYGINPNGLKIKKDSFIGNVSKNFVTSWNLELTKASFDF